MKVFGAMFSAFWRDNGKDITAIFKADWDVISGLVQAVLGVIAAILLAGLRLMKGDWTGAWDAIQEYSVIAYAGMKRAFSGMVNGIVALAKLGGRAMIEAGKLFVDGLINGIKAKVNELRQTVQILSQIAVDAAKITLGIHSPSTVMEEIGRNIGEGLVRGIQSKGADVGSAMQAILRGGKAAGGKGASATDGPDESDETRKRLTDWQKTLKNCTKY